MIHGENEKQRSSYEHLREARRILDSIPHRKSWAEEMEILKADRNRSMENLRHYFKKRNK